MEFCKTAVFESSRLLYRGISQNDSEKLVRWRSSENVYKYLKNPNPISMQEHKKWYDEYYLCPHELRAIITHKETKTDIGMVGGMVGGEAFELSYYIGEAENRGLGFAGEAIESMMKYVQSAVGITKFRAFIHKDNAASAACVTKLGFICIQTEGVMDVYEFFHESNIR